MIGLLGGPVGAVVGGVVGSTIGSGRGKRLADRLLRIPVQAQAKLGQIVGPDGETVKNVSKGIGRDYVARDLAHNIEFQAILSLYQLYSFLSTRSGAG